MSRSDAATGPVGASSDNAGAFRTPGATVAQDWPRLRDYLASHGHRLMLDPPPRQFVGGYGNLNFLVTIDGRDWVLRRPPLGPIPPGANDMGREHRVLSAIHRVYPYAPEPLIYCKEPDVLGAHFLIMEYRPGLGISGRLPTGLESRAVGPDLSRMLVALMAELHAIDAEKVGLGQFGKPAGFLARTVEGWAKRGDIALAGATSPQMGEVVAWLRANVPADQAPTLLHSDFKLDNVLLDPATLKPRTVLDWDMATRGDPLFDLATMLSYWSEAGDPPAMRNLGQMPTAEPGFLSRAQVRDLYAGTTGRDVSDFRFYRALTMFKLVVVFLQIYARYRDGTTTDARFAGLDKLAQGLLDIAHDITRNRAD